MDFYQEKLDYMDTAYKRINALAFYREIFPKGSFEEKGQSGDKKRGNGIIVYKTPKGETHTNIVFDDLRELDDCLNEKRDCYKNAPFASFSMCSYLGKNRTNKNAFECFGFAIDVDNVDKACLHRFLYQADAGITIRPTYIVISGNGIHAYYVFDEPIHLTPEKFECLKDIKHILTASVWNSHTSLSREVEFQGLVQCHRCPQSRSKLGHEVTAYKTGSKINIEDIICKIKASSIIDMRYKFSKTYKYASKYQEVKKKADRLVNDEKVSFDMIARLCYDTDHLTMEQAKEKWPEWYEKRVVNKLPSGHWTSNSALYNWWFKEISTKAIYRGRYFAIYGLTAFAQRCNISYDKLKKDAYSLLEYFDSLSPSDDEAVRFKAKDIEDAIGLYYTADLTRTTKKWLEGKVGFMLPPSQKRNGRTQNKHLSMCRFLLQQEREENPDFKEGRPPKDYIIKNYLKEHPEETNVSHIAKKCGVSRPTVYKYLKEKKEA